MNEIIVKMTNINKRFSGVHALKGVDFILHRGEIHALMGENGAGKSTLMEILTGVYKADSGEIFVFNEKCTFDSVKEAQEKGIQVVRSSRLVAGPTTLEGEVDDAKYHFVASQELNPQKARILLMLALTKTNDWKQIQDYFMEY